MATDDQVEIKYTGKRTKRDSILVHGYGTITKGSKLSVPADVAARWTTAHMTSTGEEIADFDYASDADERKANRQVKEDTRQQETAEIATAGVVGEAEPSKETGSDGSGRQDK